jgi:hypothetical protein
LASLSHTASLFASGVVGIILGVACPVSVSGIQSSGAIRADGDVAKTVQGVSFPGRVVDLDGNRPIDGAEVVVEPSVRKPAADVWFEFMNWARSDSDRTSRFSTDTTGRTDAAGRFRLRMRKTQTLTITLMPDAYAPFYRLWETDRPGQNPNVWAPTELGQLILEPGQVITGRLLGLRGGPIAGQRVIAQRQRHQQERTATTQADGSFRFAPLSARRDDRVQNPAHRKRPVEVLGRRSARDHRRRPHDHRHQLQIADGFGHRPDGC